MKIVEDASGYFPTETWDDVEYLAKLNLEHDVTIVAGGESFGAFLFERLTKRIGRIKHSNRLMNLLLGITPDPIVAIYYYLDGRRFKRTLHLVHDFMDERIGVVSLFRVNEGCSSKVVAHGLGHNRGLRHHKEPIDLMYSGLLGTPALQVEGFCKVCLRKLTEDKTNTAHKYF
ncbi:MAG: hypothetical protein ACE5IF_05230 [Candidatus Bathyarchaeia archaeon]